jgi:phosphoglycolate phosphatase
MAADPFLFDLDGTLCDTLADIAASANHVRSIWGLPPLLPAAIRAFVGDGARMLLRRALHDLPDLPPEASRFWDEAFARYASHHERQCTVHVRNYPGVQAHLQQLQEQGHPLAVVTNKPERFARAILVHTGLAPLLPVVIGGDTLPLRKPDPAPLWLALERLGRNGPPGTMVGDGENDLRAGKAAGLRTIAVLYGYRPEAVLRSLGADAYWTRFGA